jgi:uncharacterized protein
MTPEERKMLEDLANRVSQTPAPPIDKEAEEFIRTRIGSRPDALYLMTQTVLIQNLALEQAKQQIQQLQQNAGTPATQSSGSFLGGSGGQRPSNTGSQQQTSYAPPPPPAYQPVPVSGPSSSSSPGSVLGGGGGSFLRGAAQTAAGVAAGALAFEGISSLFHGGEHLGGFGGGGGGLFGGGGIGGYGGAPEETSVNNYYDSPGPEGRDNYTASGDDQNTDAGQADVGQDYDDSSQYDNTADDSSDFGGDDGSGDDSLI